MMKLVHLLAPLVVLVAQAGAAVAQEPATVQDTVLDMGVVLGSGEGIALTLSSGKTYNRVEGLPLLFGPAYRKSIGTAHLSLTALGIVRTAEGRRQDPGDLGHRLTANLRFGDERGIILGGESFDVVSKIEPWQLTEPDGALAAFFLRRDYFDWFGRHGARGYAAAFRDDVSLTLGYGHERWSLRRARDVYSMFRGDDAWRGNPVVNDGVVHLIDLSLHVDTRNNPSDPLTGWLLNAQYEHGAGDFETSGTSIQPTEPDGRARLGYGRVLIDLRRYNRISPKRQLNGRLLLGGWLHGDPLPYQRRFSVGGIGTLPGFDFRRPGPGTDVGQCSGEVSIYIDRPAECERVALGQVEYRHELVSELVDIFNRNGIRVRGAAFRVKPDAVVFFNAGRGWLLGPRDGTLRYTSGSFPRLDTFRTDAGIGLDLGIAGIYVAKAISASKEPANFFVRLRSRF